MAAGLRAAFCYPARVRHLLAPLIAVSLLLPSLASAQTAPSREQVVAMLSGIEDTPSPADWRRVGEGALPLLIELYADRSQPGFVRLRAIGAAAAFPRTATRTFLLAVAQAEDQSDLFVREAVNGLARAFGRDASPEVARFLDHRAPVVREAAARALGRVGGPNAVRALRARLSAERDVVVRESIRRALR